MQIAKARAQVWDTRLMWVLASPLAVVALGNLAARMFPAWLGSWAWIGVALTYWSSLAALVLIFGGLGQVRRWLQPSRGSWLWLVLALLLGLVAFPLLLIPEWQVLTPAPLVVAWLAFGVVNAVCEEIYWRGFLLDATAHLPRAFSVAYITVLFTILHPLMWGVFAKLQTFDPANPMAFAPFGVILVAPSLAWSIIYLRTKSLRLAILSHFLVDLGNLSIFVFMNLFVLK